VQTLLARPDATGKSNIPLTREDIYDGLTESSGRSSVA
jgi:hypothetical protein